jgi:hypothetical protein
MIRTLVAATALLTAAAAQAACTGDLVAIRVSKLKPGGSMAGFAEAAKDNAAWYASHGMKGEKFVTAPVYEQSDGEPKPSVTRVMTLHVYGGTAQPKRDAAWDAFVTKYKANSTIESETRACLPKGTIR